MSIGCVLAFVQVYIIMSPKVHPYVLSSFLPSAMQLTNSCLKICFIPNSPMDLLTYQRFALRFIYFVINVKA